MPYEPQASSLWKERQTAAPIRHERLGCAIQIHDMSHKYTTQWGGRKGRYARFPGAVSRCTDPYAESHPVEFAKPVEYEAWLSWRFDPDTSLITHSKTAISAECEGQLVECTATFVVTSRDKRETYHMVVDKASDSKGLPKLRQVAHLRRADVLVVTRDQVRVNLDKFWRLELLRAASQIHVGEGESLDPFIMLKIQEGCDTRASMQAAFSNVNPQLIDARLGHLHCGGALVLNLSTDNYQVSRCKEIAA